MANTIRHETGTWDTFHNNGPFPNKVLYETFLADKAAMPSVTDRYTDAATEMQRMLKLAMGNNEGFRAYGSAWSISHIAHQKDNMHFNAAMNLKRPVATDELHADTKIKAEN